MVALGGIRIDSRLGGILIVIFPTGGIISARIRMPLSIVLDSPVIISTVSGPRKMLHFPVEKVDKATYQTLRITPESFGI